MAMLTNRAATSVVFQMTINPIVVDYKRSTNEIYGVF